MKTAETAKYTGYIFNSQQFKRSSQVSISLTMILTYWIKNINIHTMQKVQIYLTPVRTRFKITVRKNLSRYSCLVTRDAKHNHNINIVHKPFKNYEKSQIFRNSNKSELHPRRDLDQIIF